MEGKKWILPHTRKYQMQQLMKNFVTPEILMSWTGKKKPESNHTKDHVNFKFLTVLAA